MTRNQINAACAMRNAWAIAKAAAAETGDKASVFFRAALKQAWSEIKTSNQAEITLPKLAGSDKQIKWATDIRRANMFYINRLFETARSESQTCPPQYKEKIAAIAAVLKTVAENPSAKFWIENRNKMTHDCLNDGLLPKLEKASLYVGAPVQIKYARAALKQHGYL